MGMMLSTPVELTRVQRVGNSSFRAAVAEMQGWRTGHEDAHAMKMTENAGCFWVLDGHGGSACALHCAPRLSECSSTLLAESAGELPSDEAIGTMFTQVDAEFRAKCEANSELESGSTVVGAMITKKDNGTYSVVIANAGDSRGLVIAPPGVEAGPKLVTKRPPHLKEPPPDYPLLAVSVDHKPNYYTEQERIEAAGGYVSTDDPPRLDGNLAVSRGLGDFEYKRSADLPPSKQKVSSMPDLYEVHGLAEGSICFLACDGVWDVLSDSDVEDIVRTTMKGRPKVDLGVVVAELVHKALKENSRDNVTCMVIHLVDGSDWSASSNRFNASDEMMHFDKLLGTGEDAIADDCKKHYRTFLRNCGFPLEPVRCAVTGRWFNSMYQCPGTNNNYMNRHCQKRGWERTKKGEQVRNPTNPSTA